MNRIACLLPCIFCVGNARRVQSSAAFNPAAPGVRFAAGNPSHASLRRLADRRENVRGTVLACDETAAKRAPATLAEAPCVAELEAAQISGGTAQERMGKALDYLQEMLMTLDFAEDDEDELDVYPVDPENQEAFEEQMKLAGKYTDTNFVNAGRPWMHLNEFHLVEGAGIADQMWSKLDNATYLKEGEKGGTILFMMPEQLELPLLKTFADEFESAIVSEINPIAEVKVLHPEQEDKTERFPSPMLRVFVDTPDLFSEGDVSQVFQAL